MLNYSLQASAHLGSGTTGSRFDGASASLDGWIYSPLGTLGSTGFSQFDSNLSHAKVLRLESSFRHDFRTRMLTATLGDFQTSTFQWGRSIRMGGFQIRRNFALRDDLIPQQLFAFSGAAAVPSTVDVFIDNSRAFSTRVEPGPFRIEDIPTAAGRGAAVIHVRQPDGREVTRRVSFFTARNLVKRGVLNFSLGAGYPREAYGIESNRYSGRPAYSTSLRYGLTDRLTLAAHAEGNDNLLMGTFGFTTTPFDLAETTFVLGASRHVGETGKFETGRFTYGSLRTRIGPAELNLSLLKSEKGFVDLAYVSGTNYLGKAKVQEGSGSLLDFPRQQGVLGVTFPDTPILRNVGFSVVDSHRTNRKDFLIAASWSRQTGLAGQFARLLCNPGYSSRRDPPRTESGLCLGRASLCPCGPGFGLCHRCWNRCRNLRQSPDIAAGRRLRLQSASQTRTRRQATGVRAGAVPRPVRQDRRRRPRGSGISPTCARVLTDRWCSPGGSWLRATRSVTVSRWSMSACPACRSLFRTRRDDNRPLRQGAGNGAFLLRAQPHLDQSPGSAARRGLWRDSRRCGPCARGGGLARLKADTRPSLLLVLTDAKGHFLPLGTPVYLNGGRVPVFVAYDGQVWLQDIAPRTTCASCFPRAIADCPFPPEGKWGRFATSTDGVSQMSRLSLLSCLLLSLSGEAAVASGLSCSATMTDLDFGTISIRAGAKNQTSGKLEVQCNGAATSSVPSSVVGICVTFGPGSGGAAAGTVLRYMKNSGGAQLPYTLSQSSDDTAVNQIFLSVSLLASGPSSGVLSGVALNRYIRPDRYPERLDQSGKLPVQFRRPDGRDVPIWRNRMRPCWPDRHGAGLWCLRKCDAKLRGRSRQPRLRLTPAPCDEPGRRDHQSARPLHERYLLFHQSWLRPIFGRHRSGTSQDARLSGQDRLRPLPGPEPNRSLGKPAGEQKSLYRDRGHPDL